MYETSNRVLSTIKFKAMEMKKSLKIYLCLWSETLSKRRHSSPMSGHEAIYTFIKFL